MSAQRSLLTYLADLSKAPPSKQPKLFVSYAEVALGVEVFAAEVNGVIFPYEQDICELLRKAQNQTLKADPGFKLLIAAMTNRRRPVYALMDNMAEMSKLKELVKDALISNGITVADVVALPKLKPDGETKSILPHLNKVMKAERLRNPLKLLLFDCAHEYVEEAHASGFLALQPDKYFDFGYLKMSVKKKTVRF